MKKKRRITGFRSDIDWDSISEQTRQRCNKLTNEQRQRLRADALRIIYSSDAKTTARSG
jgi:hypothetical protein